MIFIIPTIYLSIQEDLDGYHKSIQEDLEWTRNISVQEDLDIDNWFRCLIRLHR